MSRIPFQQYTLIGVQGAFPIAPAFLWENHAADSVIDR
jgi:hypothetical protein